MAIIAVGAISLIQILPAASSASGQTLASAQAEASAIVGRLNYLGGQVSYLSEKYDTAQLSLDKVNQLVSSEQNQIAKTEANIKSIKSKLASEAISAYISGGNLPEFSALLNENPTQSSIRQEFLNTVTSSQSDIIASFQAANQSLKQQQTVLKVEQNQATTALASANAARTAAQAAVDQEKAQLGSINSNIATLVSQQQTAQAQQAAAKAKQIVFNSGSQPTQNTTSTNGGQTNSAPPINGSQVSIALAWARRELGKPYVYGGAGPNVFDCSGLTAYVFGKAGISLPHSAAAQYSDTARVSLSQLQPGDLVFYYSPISHVGIYIGGGQVLQALNASAPVEISSLYWAGVPVGAGRVS